MVSVHTCYAGVAAGPTDTKVGFPVAPEVVHPPYPMMGRLR